MAWDRFVSRSFGADIRREIRESVRARSVTSTGALLERARTREHPEGRGTALGQADARHLAEEARQRRREAYEAGKRALRGQTVAPPAPPLDGGGQEEEKSGLLAAKRRAQQRISEDADER